MSGMTDPMDALVQLQLALDNRVVSLNPCELHKDILVVADQPNGTPRYTYVKIGENKVQSIALFVRTEPIKGTPCFQLGWATIENMRGLGFAKQVTEKGIDELANGLGRHGIDKFYIEAIISDSNQPSINIANKLLSDSPENGTDSLSGEPALQFLRIVN